MRVLLAPCSALAYSSHAVHERRPSHEGERLATPSAAASTPPSAVAPHREGSKHGAEDGAALSSGPSHAADASERARSLGGILYTPQEPEFFNETFRRCWNLCGPDFSRRLQRKIDKGLAKALDSQGFGTLQARVDVGPAPFRFEKLRMATTSPEHIRFEADFVWRGGLSLEVAFATKAFSVPLKVLWDCASHMASLAHTQCTASPFRIEHAECTS